MNKSSTGYTGEASALPRTRSRTTSPTQDDAGLTADSTQTLRVLSKPELDDPKQPKWYVVQLVISDRPINLDMMPRLDVFAAYRLYAVARQQGTPLYVLRLGFFSEEAIARTICGYLSSFFASPSVVRVSAAEQARFGEPTRPSAPQKQPVSSHANVVPLSSGRDTSTQPAATAVFVKSPSGALASGSDAKGGASVAKAVGSHARSGQAIAQQAISAPKRFPPPASTGSSRPAVKKSKSLAEELREEARQVQISKTGRYRQPERKHSWLSRFLGLAKK